MSPYWINSRWKSTLNCQHIIWVPNWGRQPESRGCHWLTVQHLRDVINWSLQVCHWLKSPGMSLVCSVCRDDEFSCWPHTQSLLSVISLRVHYRLTTAVSCSVFLVATKHKLHEHRQHSVTQTPWSNMKSTPCKENVPRNKQIFVDKKNNSTVSGTCQCMGAPPEPALMAVLYLVWSTCPMLWLSYFWNEVPAPCG